MWSLGVLLHLVVRGKLPFDHNDRAELVRSILHDAVDFDHGVWQSFSPDGRDFAARLLDRNPATRLTARAALQHPWLRADEAADL